jgi:hypothetical protein
MLEDYGISYSELLVDDEAKWEAAKMDYNNYPFNQSGYKSVVPAS